MSTVYQTPLADIKPRIHPNTHTYVHIYMYMHPPIHTLFPVQEEEGYVKQRSEIAHCRWGYGSSASDCVRNEH